MDERRINRIITEEITKAEVNSIVQDKIASSYRGSDFDKAVRGIAADVVDKLFKILWQQSNTWKGRLSR